MNGGFRRRRQILLPFSVSRLSKLGPGVAASEPLRVSRYRGPIRWARFKEIGDYDPAAPTLPRLQLQI